MAEQTNMPGMLAPVRPRKAPRILMHVVDAGDSGCDDGNAGIAIFKCSKCGHKTDWTGFRTFTEAKRGIPCERCNGESR